MDGEERARSPSAPADAYADVLVPALFEQWPERVLDAAGVVQGHDVLDVGCGTGVLGTTARARVGSDGAVVGIDPNAAMLSVAGRSSDHVRWVAGRAEHLPFADASFDRVVSQFAIMFFADVEAGVSEMSRVLRKGGRTAIATWASLDENPGYGAFVELLRRVVGEGAAEAMTAPFVLGDPDELGRLVEGHFDDVVVEAHDGVARFDSIETWVRTDTHGPLLAGTIDDERYELFLREAREELARFTTDRGRVTFRAPALIATGKHPV